MAAQRFPLVCGAALLVSTSVYAAPAAGATEPPGWGGAQHRALAGAKPIGASQPRKTSSGLSLHSSQPTGAVEPNPVVYLVFWGNQWANDPAGAAPALTSLFRDLYGSADTWGHIMTQYCEGLPAGTVTCGASGTHIQEPVSPVLADVWFDNGGPAPTKASNSQIAAEAVAAAAHFGNTTQDPNLDAQYVIASASGTHPGGFPNGGFCAWHSSTSSTYGNIAYTNLPYVPDLGPGACTTIASPRPLDGYESTETHEYAETVTDPFPSNGWLKGGSEIGDLCVSLDSYLTINGGTFDVQGLWSNSAGGCVTQG